MKKARREESVVVNKLLAALQQEKSAKDSEASHFFEEFAKTAHSYIHHVEHMMDVNQRKMSTRDRQYVMGKAVERLITEWRRVEPIYRHLLGTGTSVDGDNEIIKQIRAISDSAKQVLITSSRDLSEMIDTDIILRFDVSFSLLRAPYYPQKSLLTVPIYTMPFTQLQKIIWHELASLAINPDGKAPLPTKSSQSSYQPSDIYHLFKNNSAKTIDWSIDPDFNYQLSDFQDEKDDWKKFWLYWASILFKGSNDIDIHALPQMIHYPNKRAYLIDWRIAHLEELVEDACSTIVFGVDVYETYIEVFHRFYDGNLQQPDMRHPAPEFRLEVTYQLLKIMKEQKQDLEIPDAIVPDGIDDPIADKHGKIPGAIEIANWIFDNQSAVIKPKAPIQEIRSELFKAGNLLNNTFSKHLSDLTASNIGEFIASQVVDGSEEYKVDEPIANQVPGFQFPEEAELQLFAHIDLGVGDLPPVGGAPATTAPVNPHTALPPVVDNQGGIA